MKTGVVGFGVAAQFMHLPFIVTNPDFQLRKILQRHGDTAKEKYPDVEIVRSLEEMLAYESLELIVITTPNDSHFDYAFRSLEAGKHVVLEKPFTITSEDARKLITREENTPGSGILYDLGAHLIDQAFCLFGLPRFVTADIRIQRPHARTTDYFELWLDYGFTKVILKAGMLVREPGPRYLIHGRMGSFIKSGEDPQEALLRKGILPTAPDWGMESDDIYGFLHTEFNGKLIREKYPSLPGNYGGFYADLYNTIRKGAVLRVKPEHGYNVIRLIELATQSSEEKRRVECSQLIEIPYP